MIAHLISVLFFLIFLSFFSWDFLLLLLSFFFFLQRGSLLPAKCVVFQVHATHPRGVPDNNPQRESLMNRVTIRGKSINVCIAVLKNAAVVCRGIYLINGSFNPRKESLLLPSLGSIWSPCKHSALWSERTNLKWIAALLHGFTDTLSEAQTLKIAVARQVDGLLA